MLCTVQMKGTGVSKMNHYHTVGSSVYTGEIKISHMMTIQYNVCFYLFWGWTKMAQVVFSQKPPM